MHRYIYNYQTLINFSSSVGNHHILLRCEPMRSPRQKIEEEHLIYSPIFQLRENIDCFGNRIRYGGTQEMHQSLAYISTGIVCIDEEAEEVCEQVPYYYRIPSVLTTPNQKIDSMAQIIKDISPEERINAICSRVYEAMDYVSGTTVISTPAADALAQGRGVCADYSHLMIAICRKCGLPARYVSGFMEGIGETHAWVEVYDGRRWLAYDPTNNCKANIGYVKLAHGRDAMDCAVSRGMYTGYAGEMTRVEVTLQEI